ncbi:MAG: AAA family ATPase, partial [Pseudonocardiales bacterium]
MTGPLLEAHEADSVAHFAETVIAGIEPVVLGKHAEIQLALTCLLASGHLLIEDVPGTGKTSLAKALASSISGTTHRIQFTPDLLPTDITGVSVWDQRTATFEFHPGPIFANVVVADEINRASPKTQSALLEVMEERQVTVDGVAYEVPSPFLVVATQ